MATELVQDLLIQPYSGLKQKQYIHLFIRIQHSKMTSFIVISEFSRGNLTSAVEFMLFSDLLSMLSLSFGFLWHD